MGLVPTSARLHCLSLSTIKRTIPLSYTHAPTSMQAWTHTDATDYTQRKQGGRLHQLLSKVVGIVDHIYYLLLHTFPLALYPICSGPAHIYLIGASAGRTLAANVGLALLEPLFIPLLKRLEYSTQYSPLRIAVGLSWEEREARGLARWDLHAVEYSIHSHSGRLIGSLHARHILRCLRKIGGNQQVGYLSSGLRSEVPRFGRVDEERRVVRYGYGWRSTATSIVILSKHNVVINVSTEQVVISEAFIR
mmetsp:Transcript_30681/g.80184  ORF Transcript_30681/g.80184 Transcript_30681/m.80184 type:complete len:249 (+) Transcript_30681:2212-2958(+)